MGLHASYYPISPSTLTTFIDSVHSTDFWKLISTFRDVSEKQEFYIGTTWHVLDFIINPTDAVIPELMYAVRGHEFPAPDGSVRLEPHLPSYGDEHWQGYTYVTAEEAGIIAKYLQLIDESEFEARFVPEKMKGVYRRPMSAEDDKEKYFKILMDLQDFYDKVAASKMAVLIGIG
jgi:hypothetical protein